MGFKNTLREGLNDCIEQSFPTYNPPNMLEEFPKFPKLVFIIEQLYNEKIISSPILIPSIFSM